MPGNLKYIGNAFIFQCEGEKNKCIIKKTTCYCHRRL